MVLNERMWSIEAIQTVQATKAIEESFGCWQRMDEFAFVNKDQDKGKWGINKGKGRIVDKQRQT